MDKNVVILCLIIAVNLLNTLITFITATSKISDNRRVWFNSLTTKGKIVIVFAITTIILAAYQYYLSEAEARNKEIQAEKKQHQRDAEAKETINANSRQIILTFTEALAKYGLKYDSTNRNIQKYLLDSSRSNITNNYGEDPSIIICPEDGIQGILDEKGDSILKINICNYKATSRIIDFSLILIAFEGDVFIDSLAYVIILKPLPKKTILVDSQVKSITYKPRYQETRNTTYYFLLKAKYSNSDDSKNFDSELLYEFKRIEKKAFMVNDQQASKVKKSLVKLGVNFD